MEPRTRVGDPVETTDNDLLTIGDEVTDAARVMMPWMTSVLVHACVIVLLLLTIPLIIVQSEEPQLVVRGGFGGEYHEQVGSGDQTELMRGISQRQLDTAPVDSTSTSDPAFVSVIGQGSLPAELQNLIGGGRGGTASTNDGLGTMLGNGRGPSSPFDGPPGPDGAQPTRIIYVIDASGSLATDLDVVLMQLRQSIRRLTEDQFFTVIFFQREVAIEVVPRGMKPATEANKLAVQAWLDPTRGNIVPGGSSSPLRALRQAMAYKPQALYILSDNITGSGPYELDREQLLRELEHLNPAKATRIHTIQFLSPDPQHTLADIAAAHGGQHKMIKQADVWLGRSGASR